MRKLMISTALFLALVTVALVTVANRSYAQDAPLTNDSAKDALLAECPICTFDLSQYAGPLTKDEVESLLLALNDEYHAYAVYGAVIEQFGALRPMTSIQRAEAQHTQAVVRLMTKYNVPVPANPWLEADFAFSSMRAACTAGVEAEILNRDLYTILFTSTDRADLTQLFTSLQRASEENHLPAFERCAAC